MGPRRFYVYNETNECFLSLGVTLGNHLGAQFRGMFRKRSYRFVEGSWIPRSGGVTAVGLLSARDLIYLDDREQVVHLIESFPRFRMAPKHSGAHSVLTLPESTIESSQTRMGDHLVISAAEEMEACRPGPAHATENNGRQPATGSSAALTNWNSQMPELSPAPDLSQVPEASEAWKRDRRIAPRRRWPRLAAVESGVEAIARHAVRDISTTGMYLLTEERWPVGTRVRMTLQRTDGLDDATMIPTTVELRVSRWDEDGVGLEFVAANAEHSALVSMHVR